MQSNEITWKIVSNTVTKRMIDHSLIHKLVPSRRLRRKNKAMNIALKQCHGLKTYSQYVNMKTSILRNLSDDSETDDNDSFTEDDYNILYKSDLSLANYMAQMSNKSKHYSSFEVEFEASKSDISVVKNAETPTKKLKRKSSNAMDLGWQKIAKKRTKSTSSFIKKTKTKDFTRTNVTCQMSNIQNNTQVKLKTLDKFFMSYSKNDTPNPTNEVINTSSNEACTVEETTDICAVTPNSNEIICDTTVAPEVTNNDNNKLLQSNPMASNSEKFQLDENHSSIKLDSPNVETLKKVQKNLTTLSDNVNKIQNINDSLDQNDSTRAEKNQNIKEAFLDKVKNNKCLIIQPSVTGSTHQPKDSGIEEDTEEESVEPGKKHYKKLEARKAEQNVLTTSFTVTYKCNLTDCDDNSTSKSCNVSSKSDFKDIATPIDENIRMNQGEYREEVQKHKLQPKVTHSEIFSKKYKIVCNTSMLNNSVEPEKLNTEDCSDEKYETEETEQHTEDSISPLTKKRLQQLRRLNLTEDNDSSLSENDETYSTIENMRDKLFKRSKESSDILNSKDGSVNCKHEVSNQFDRKLQKNKNSLKKITYCLDNENNILKQHSKVKKDSFVDIEQLSFASNESVSDKSSYLGPPTSNNFDYKEDPKGSKGKNLQIETTIQAVNNVNHRPYNLQELIKKENLTHEMTTPSFKFNDIQEEDELFVIDIPSVVLENQLLGSKIILTENQLKLGKQKYRVECKDINKISCVFARRKSHKPYKIVNIKPMARIVAWEKINCAFNTDKIAR